jgi:CRISPR/Cas system-associated endonuclease Cas1
MELHEIVEKINGRVISNGNSRLRSFDRAFASDLMSDVLTLKNDNLVLITGLATLQTIRTAEMADINCIIIVRNKKASPEMVQLAAESGIDLIECQYSMFRTSGLLFESGLKPVY